MGAQGHAASTADTGPVFKAMRQLGKEYKVPWIGTQQRRSPRSLPAAVSTAHCPAVCGRRSATAQLAKHGTS